ncbi:zinc/cadmium resistance protein [Megalops cyprinoides]|uniref:zinc/cadmium resistance protein n=1 Tax=Megalops cyprinoides TaxID=118141 RepID=UPI00186433C8|nr:zinc/cadmium resistance protein [Megalops cyprinoides]
MQDRSKGKSTETEGRSGEKCGCVMACRSDMLTGTRYVCLLCLTALLLLFKIVVSRLCNSLINMPTLPTLPPTPSPSIIQIPTQIAPPLSVTCPTPPMAPPAPPTTPSLTPLSSSLCLPYGWARLQPLGALVSALLLASLCVSVTLDILSHALQPHPIQRPLLATVAGAASLLFNTLVLGAHWAGLLKLDYGQSCCSPKDERCQNSGVHDKAGVSVQTEEIKVTEDAEGNCGSISFHQAEDGFQSYFRDGELLFCNPDGGTGLTAHPIVQSHAETPTFTKSWCCSLHWLVMLVQSLLGPVLVLTNGLALLLSDPDCQHSPAGCGIFLYLDPGFSLLTALVLVASALPQARRHGFLLLQGAPPHISPDGLARRIATVPGVLSVHELHVWQLTEACLVASVHVHCHPELLLSGAPELVAGVAEVLRGAGVMYSTVQPEFLTPARSGTAAAAPHFTPAHLPALHCSLACGKQCAAKMCCKSQGESAPSGGDPGDA